MATHTGIVMNSSKSVAHYKSQAWHLPGESWRDIPGFAELYQVSDFGRVRGLARVVETSNGRKRTVAARVLRPKHGTDDYLFVSLYKGGEQITARIHRLVALAFVGDAPSDKYNVHHKNGVKTDNRPDNLEYMHEIAHRSYHSRGAGNGNAVLSPSDVVTIKAHLAAGRTQADLARKFGVHHSTISGIRRGKSWQHVRKVHGRPSIIGNELILDLRKSIKQAAQPAHMALREVMPHWVIPSEAQRQRRVMTTHSTALRYASQGLCRVSEGEIGHIYLYQGICIGWSSTSEIPPCKPRPI